MTERGKCTEGGGVPGVRFPEAKSQSDGLITESKRVYRHRVNGANPVIIGQDDGPWQSEEVNQSACQTSAPFPLS